MCSVDTQPLRSLKELWDWKPDGISQNLIAKPLQNCEFHQKRTETLICHDMAGGYLPEERFTGCQITEKSTPFIVMHWWYMDIFVYFSHQFITIPPVGWINQAHSHKVMVLGTFITEWTSGAKICSEILASAENVERTVDKLVEIAKFYNFEGWLVNIENEIEPTQLEMLHRFVSLLTERSRAALGECSRVIWYDAVTIEGKLLWQNCLNDANERWFNETNGIFLNYNWTLEKLKESLKRAEQRHHHVYVGVDCFGRGCYGGGGWNCCEAFKQIRKNDLSVALFAPGWVAETLPPSDIISNSLRFWDRLGAFLHSRPINSLPLETDFSVGFHETSDNCVCYNLSKASLQPHYLANGAFPTAGRSSSLILPGRTIYKLFEMNLRVKGDLVVLVSADQPLKLLVWMNDNERCLPEDEVNEKVEEKKRNQEQSGDKEDLSKQEWRLKYEQEQHLVGIGFECTQKTIIKYFSMKPFLQTTVSSVEC